MFGIILISACTLMHIYVCWRAARVPFLNRHVSGPLFLAVAAALWAVLVLGRFYGHHNTGPWAWAVELVGMIWIGVLLLNTVSFLLVDLVTGFGFLFPRWVPSLRGCALVAGMALSATALVQGFRAPVVEQYEVRLKGLPDALDGSVVVGVSDLHIGSLLGPDWLADRIAQIQAEKPDLVVLLGDLFEGHGAGGYDDLLPVLQGLSAPLGVWAVPGNHEAYGGFASLGLLRDAGVKLLRNRWTQVRPGLILAGVDDLTANRRSGGGDLVEEALASRPPGATVFLSHTPWEAEKAADLGVGLMLSGHTHGGQIWPFNYLVRRAYPLLAGQYEVNGMAVIVCRGTGTWGPRMRLWRAGEILRVTLRIK